jgi:predicted transcriptional regulator
MKIAISLPPDLGKEADRLAKKLKLSRSELYRRAVKSMLEQERDAAISEQLNRVYASEDSTPDLFMQWAAYESFRRMEEEEKKDEARRDLVGKPAAASRIGAGLPATRAGDVQQPVQRHRDSHRRRGAAHQKRATR